MVETNFVSALVILGSGLGLLASVALRSDKAGFMSAGLLLFGLATIWLPPVRAALFTWPLATISVLICLGLIFKFTHEGGVAGLMTGGVLALFMIFVIFDDTLHRQPTAPNAVARQQAQPKASGNAPQPPSSGGSVQQRPPVGPTVTARAPAPQPPTPPEARELRAARGSVLKFVAGVPYQIKVRAGFTTTLDAMSGAVAFYRGGVRVGDCVTTMRFVAAPAPSPTRASNRLIQACVQRRGPSGLPLFGQRFIGVGHLDHEATLLARPDEPRLAFLVVGAGFDIHAKAYL